MRTDILSKPYLLIPAYDGYEFAKEDLTNLLKSLEMGNYKEHFRVLVLLDGAHRIFQHTFEFQFKDFEFCNHTGNPKNFVGNVNIGLRRAREEGVGALVVNQDCILPNAKYLLDTIDDNAMVALSTVEVPNENLEGVLRCLNELSNNKEENIPVSQLSGHKVPGYAFYVGANVLQEAGVLWEGLTGGYDDDEMTARVLLAGFAVEQAPAYCQHLGSHIDQMAINSSRSGAYRPSDLGLYQMKFRGRYSVPNNIPDGQIIQWILANFKWDKELMYCE